jgi:hypothetical protein
MLGMHSAVGQKLTPLYMPSACAPVWAGVGWRWQGLGPRRYEIIKADSSLGHAANERA